MRIEAPPGEFAQVLAALQWIFQSTIGLVDAHRPLHRHALRSGAFNSEAVRVHFGLQRTPALRQRIDVDRKAALQPEQREVVVIDLHRSNDFSKNSDSPLSR